jgi:hypothetical protein
LLLQFVLSSWNELCLLESSDVEHRHREFMENAGVAQVAGDLEKHEFLP